MTEVRVGGESRGFVQDRFPHGRGHRIAHLVIARLEVCADIWVLYFLETPGAEAAICEEECQLKERETVCREDIERVPKKFIGTRSEMIKGPPLTKHPGEFRDANQVR